MGLSVQSGQSKSWKIRQREGDTHQSYKHIAPVYAIAIVDSNYFQDD